MEEEIREIKSILKDIEKRLKFLEIKVAALEAMNMKTYDYGATIIDEIYYSPYMSNNKENDKNG